MTLAARYELYRSWCLGMRLEHGIATPEKWDKTQAKLPDYMVQNADFILMNGKTKRRRRESKSRKTNLQPILNHW